MILNVFSVFDAKMRAFLRPFFETNRGTAIRAFVDAGKDPEHAFSQHAEDFSLFHLGEFDQESGEFNLLPAPEPLGNVLQLRPPAELREVK